MPRCLSWIGEELWDHWLSRQWQVGPSSYTGPQRTRDRGALAGTHGVVLPRTAAGCPPSPPLTSRRVRPVKPRSLRAAAQQAGNQRGLNECIPQAAPGRRAIAHPEAPRMPDAGSRLPYTSVQLCRFIQPHFFSIPPNFNPNVQVIFFPHYAHKWERIISSCVNALFFSLLFSQVR